MNYEEVHDRQRGFRLAVLSIVAICHVCLSGCVSQVPQPVSRESVILVPTAIVSIEPHVMVAFDPRDMIPVFGMPLNSIGRESTENALLRPER